MANCHTICAGILSVTQELEPLSVIILPPWVATLHCATHNVKKLAYKDQDFLKVGFTCKHKYISRKASSPGAILYAVLYQNMKAIGPFLNFLNNFFRTLKVLRTVLRSPTFQWAPQGGVTLGFKSCLHRPGAGDINPSHKQIRCTNQNDVTHLKLF